MDFSQSKRPLMGTDNILDLQNNGYKSTVSAIAEIVDNSIQADAKKIDIILINDTNKHSENIDEILIIDDGIGMDIDTFGKALMMNAGTRSQAREGLGKYGQGLPNSSVSQTTRVEVYSYQDNNILFDYIDLIEIHKTQDPFLPIIEVKEQVDIPFIIDTNYQTSKSGTIVRWVHPNKVKPSTTWLLIENIKKVLGRIFRYYLSGFEKNGQERKVAINIDVYDFNGKLYSLNSSLSSKSILPFDPMFLLESTWMNQEFPDWEHPTSQLFEIAKKKFEVEVNSDKNVLEKVSTEVQIKFSHVKKKERFRKASKGGVANPQFREIYKRRNIKSNRGYQNISITREGREIDHGDFGFLGAIDSEILRWWSIEINVEPVLDSILGIDNKKQQASNIYHIDGAEDDDSHPILKWISEVVKTNIKSLENVIKNQYSGDEPSTPTPNPNPPLPPIGPTEPPSEPEEDIDPTEEDKSELFKWIKDRFEDLSDEEIGKRVEWAFSISDKYIFVYSNLGDTSLYEFQAYGNKVLIEINRNHNFYSRFIKELGEDNTDKRIRSIRLLICSLVKAEISNETESKEINRYLRKFKNEFSIVLDEYIDDLYAD